MRNEKKKILLEEIKYYLPYASNITDSEKQMILKEDFSSIKLQKIYDYFYSHIDEFGNITSLESNALKSQEIKNNYEYYKKINDEFIKSLRDDKSPLYFFDVDNTLTDNAFLSDEKKEYISNFPTKERIILSTGKIYTSIKNVIDDCNIQNNYCSCLNGSVIQYQNKFEVVSKLGSVCKDIIEKLNNTNIEYLIYYQNEIIQNIDLSDENEKLLKQYNEWYLQRVEEVEYEKVVKIMTFIKKGRFDQEKIIDEIVEKYPDLIAVRTANHCYEILKFNQHKGNTVKMISERLGYYYRNTIAVGDSMNDLKMLDYCGKAYIVNNASEDLEKIGFEKLEENRNVDIVNLIKKYQ